MIRRAMLAFAAGAIAGSSAMVLLAAGDFDRIPPKASEIESLVRAKDVKLAKAIELAEKAGRGMATSAAYNLEAAGREIDVVVYGGGERHNVRIDAQNGKVVANVTVPAFSYPGDPVSGEWTETDSGLKYSDIVVGDGDQPAGPTSQVTVHYTGWLVDGTKFDSSVDRGTPATFPLNRVIAGWTEGVGSMRIGGKRKLVIPYQLAYGEAGRGPVIPPKAMLIFDVELLEIKGQ